MSPDFDEDREERDEPTRESDSDVIARARKKLATPGLMLLLAGLIGVMLELASIGLMVSNPTVMYDFMVKYIENNVPNGPQKQKQLDDLKKSQDQMRLDSPTNIASAGIGLLLGVMVVVGGIK